MKKLTKKEALKKIEELKQYVAEEEKKEAKKENMKKKEEYKGVKTTVCIDEGVEESYYEKAFDANREGLLIGDEVKVISIENNPPESLGKVYEVSGIFEGDLMLGDPYFYCWPGNVIKCKKRRKETNKKQQAK